MVKSAKNNTATIKKIVAAVAITLTAALVSPLSHAAGLGKLNVLSSLGQPLQAEVDLVSLQKGELESLVARVASPDAFRDAGLEYASSLNNVKFAIEKRANGQAYLRISTTQPVNEPIMDLLIDLTWSSGRLLREYPILLDPPGFAANRAATAPVVTAPMSQAPAQVISAPPVVTYVQPAAPAPAAPIIRQPVIVSQPAPIQAAPIQAAPAASTGSGVVYGPVKPGETLYMIAQQNKPDSVSVDQMLVSLYRQNKDAFINNNMNFLKKGQVLKLPTAEEAAAIASAQATREVRVQTANWSAFRQKLAAAVSQSPAKPQQSTSQSASGKIESKTADKAAADAGKSVVKLSKGDTPDGKDASGKPSGKSDAANVTALKEEITRRDNALKEANSRVAELEKTVANMNKLLALKNGTLAQAGKPVDPKAAVVDAKPVDPKAAKPVDAKAADPKLAAKADPAKPVDAKPAEVKPVAPKPAEVKSVETKPAETKPVVAAAAPAEASMLDTVMDTLTSNMLPILGTVFGLGAVGAGIAFMRKKKSNKTLAELDETATDNTLVDLKPVSQGVPTAGVVDTSGDSSFLTDFDKTGPGVIDTEEVDPVAEADVYMAYGRDTQAEEILKEAMAKDGDRHEIPMKLLDIYSNRGSKGAFENVAKELHASLGDKHPMWEKVREMGLKLDPGNALYGGAAAAALLAGTGALAGLDMDSDRTLPARPEALATAPIAGAAPDIDFDFLSDDLGAKPATDSMDLNLAKGDDLGMDLNLSKGNDLGMDLNLAKDSHVKIPADGGMDLDFGAPDTKVAATDFDPLAVSTDLANKSTAPDFDLGFGDIGSFDPKAASAVMDMPLDKAAPVASSSTDLDFDFTPAPSSKVAAVDMPLDLTELSLDLNAPAAGTETMRTSKVSASAARRPEAQWQNAATKLDLARAYLEIGDKEGAKEILQEVMTLGNADQQKTAKELSASLS